jgi:hypothetical protein
VYTDFMIDIPLRAFPDGSGEYAVEFRIVDGEDQMVYQHPRIYRLRVNKG